MLLPGRSGLPSRREGLPLVRVTCEADGHVGDRLVDRFDVCELRLEARRVHSQARERTRTLSRWCMACVRARFDEFDPSQAGMF